MGFRLQFPSSLAALAVFFGFIVLLIGLLWLARRFAPVLAPRFTRLKYIPSHYLKRQAQPGALAAPGRLVVAGPGQAAAGVTLAAAATPAVAPSSSTQTAVLAMQLPVAAAVEAASLASAVAPLADPMATNRRESTSVAFPSPPPWQHRRPVPLHRRPALGKQRVTSLQR